MPLTSIPSHASAFGASIMVPPIVSLQPGPQAVPDAQALSVPQRKHRPQGADTSRTRPSCTQMLDACCVPRRGSIGAAVRATQCTPCFTREALDCVAGELDADASASPRTRAKARGMACLTCGPRIVPFVVLDVWLALSYPVRVCVAAALAPCSGLSGPRFETRAAEQAPRAGR